MDFLYDTNSQDTMVAVDIRDCKEPISPQYSDAAVLLTYPDAFAWLFGNAEIPEYYTYVKTFKTYGDYCSWINRNT